MTGKQRLAEFLLNPEKYWNLLLSPLRARLLWLYDVQMGPGVGVIGKPLIINRGAGIRLGMGVRLYSAQSNHEIALPSRVVLTTRGEGRIEIGDHAMINGSTIRSFHRVTVGKNVWISSNCTIMDSHGHALDPDTRLNKPDEHGEGAPVTIEDNVWMGIDCKVLPGVVIGKNSVISLGSMVTQNIPPNSLAAGVPAKVISKLTI
ncbi:MAG: acyltransferase [Magnetococcales bacterium]|nr:acyltransferase [Magnetococcales bacterium]